MLDYSFCDTFDHFDLCEIFQIKRVNLVCVASTSGLDSSKILKYRKFMIGKAVVKIKGQNQ